MHSSTSAKLKGAFIRVGLWLVSLLLADAFFNLCDAFSILFRGPGIVPNLLFVMTIIYAFPAWLLFLPIVIALKDAEGRRIWSILVAGFLIGPLSLLLLYMAIRLVYGGPQPAGSHNPPTGGEMLLFAVIVGSLTTSFYVIGLKILHKCAGCAASG